MDIKIEDGIPFKSSDRSGYPLGEMKAGQSFTVDNADGSKIRSAINYYKIKNPKTRFSTRKTEDGRIRVWRLA